MELDGIGEVFFAYMKEISAVKFKENKIPKTVSKQDQIIESLHSIHMFIKEHYLSAGNGIDNSFTSFYDIYSARHEKPASKIAISKILITDLNIKVFQKRLGKDRYKWLNISFESLYTIYKNKGWIHDTDEINSPKEYLEDIK